MTSNWTSRNYAGALASQWLDRSHPAQFSQRAPERSRFKLHLHRAEAPAATHLSLDNRGPRAVDQLVAGAVAIVDEHRRRQPERSCIGSASAARHWGGSKGSAKYWVSWATRPPENSMMLTEWDGTPS